VIKNIPFAKPYFTDEDLEEIILKIRGVLQSGWLTSGPYTKQFEQQFGSYIGVSHAIAVNSCTAALHSILLALGIEHGDEVIVPSNTFVATANSALYVGARPVFADSDPETFNISPSEIQNKLSRKTKAIIVVHIGGNPCEMKEIMDIAEDHKIPIIEDAAHAHGSKYGDNFCGSMGLAAGFSFYPTKVMTCGEGGIVVTEDEKLAEKIKMIRNHGRSSYGPVEISELGYNFRLTDIHAVIGLTQFKHLNEYVQHRNKIARFYNDELSKISWLTPQKIKNSNLSSYYVYIVKIGEDGPITRNELALRLKERGIGTSVLYYPVHLQPLYIKLFKFKRGTLPIAEELGERTIALPMDNGISIEDAKYVVEMIKQIVNEW